MPHVPMEFQTMLQRLWQLRLFVALGVLGSAAVAIYVGYVISFSPFALTPRASSFGAAQGTMYVDYPRSNLAGNARDTVPLYSRAEVFARFISTRPIESSIADQLGVTTRDITVEGPFANQIGRAGAEPSAQQRANQILGEGAEYRVFVDTEADLPTITLFTQAPSGDDAIELARATTQAVQDYSDRLRSADRRTQQEAFEDALDVSEANGDLSAAERRQRERSFFQGGAVVRSVGAPLGGDVTDQTSKLILILVFGAAVVAWCAFLLVASAAVSAARASRPRR